MLDQLHSTPWGAPQSKCLIAEGIAVVTTATHGGVLLSAKRYAEFQRHFPLFEGFEGGRWFEEDYDATLIILAFPEHFKKKAVHAAVRALRVGMDYYGEAAVNWLTESEQGREVSGIYAEFEAEIADLWELGGMGSVPGHIRPWYCTFRRPDGASRGVTFPGYPEKNFYTDDELNTFALAWQAKQESDDDHS